MATEPIAPQTGYSLEDSLARFDILIDELAGPVAEQPSEVAELDAQVSFEVPKAKPKQSRPAKTRKASQPEAGTLKAKAPRQPGKVVLAVRGLTKSFGETLAVDDINLTVHAGTMFGILGPNGAGKTTTLSMITGLLRPDAGEIRLADADVWGKASSAKGQMGILPDRLMLFDRLSGRQMLHYTGLLRGLDAKTAKARTAALVSTFDIADAQDRLVADYSAGMTKKLAIAAAMIHAPRLLVLDEPFESVDSVSASRIIDILNNYVDAGGTVVLSSHSMQLIEHTCDQVAVFVDGNILSAGTVAEVRGDQSLEDRFIDLVSASNAGEDLEWLRSFSD